MQSEHMAEEHCKKCGKKTGFLDKHSIAKGSGYCLKCFKEKQKKDERRLYSKEDLQKLLLPDINLKLRYEEDPQNSVIRIIPLAFLGIESFTKLANVVRELSGKYVSAGKDSHFEVPYIPLHEQETKKKMCSSCAYSVRRLVEVEKASVTNVFAVLTGLPEEYETTNSGVVSNLDLT